MSETQLAAQKQQQQRKTVKALLENPAMKSRFAEILKERAPQFLAAVTSQAASALSQCNPESVVACAFLAATLNLPVTRELGYAWMIPYKTGKETLAQFQLGYKGLVQLAQRSAMYQRINACVITDGAFLGWDEIGEPLIDFAKIDSDKPAIGYWAGFRLVNGFTKSVYWSHKQATSHGKRFSKTFANGPWKTDFDAMALKSVLKMTLSKWGPLSIELNDAAIADQSAATAIGSDPIYVDRGEDTSDVSSILMLASQRDDPDRTGDYQATRPAVEAPTDPVKTPDVVSTPEPAKPTPAELFAARIDAATTLDQLSILGEELGSIEGMVGRSTYSALCDQLAARLTAMASQ